MSTMLLIALVRDDPVADALRLFLAILACLVLIACAAFILIRPSRR